MVKGDVQSINIKWNFKNLSDHKKTLPVNARIALNKSGGQASSQLILTDVSVANAGVYYCSAVLKFKAVSGHDCQNTPVEMYKASTEIEKGKILPHFWPMSLFCHPLKTPRKPNDFLMFSVGVKRKIARYGLSLQALVKYLEYLNLNP